MKTAFQTKKTNFWRYVLDLPVSIAKTLWGELVSKGNAFQPFPDEAPH